MLSYAPSEKHVPNLKRKLLKKSSLEEFNSNFPISLANTKNTTGVFLSEV